MFLGCPTSKSISAEYPTTKFGFIGQPTSTSTTYAAAHGQLTPPDAATKWRRPEALHCAIPWTYIASTHPQSNARILELFFHDNVTYQWLLTWLQRPAKMYLPNICRIRKNCFKNWRALRSYIGTPPWSLWLVTTFKSTELQSWWRMRVEH